MSGEPPLRDQCAASAGVLLSAVMPVSEAADCAARVLDAQAKWTSDFGGEQFALGRAFYTHLETGRVKEYFAHARASDALVESVLPGIQEKTFGLLARMLGGSVRKREGFCGPGVHVFPAGGKVAREGGVVHFDLEGLSEYQKAARSPAVSLVWMLQPGVWGGGLRLFDVLFDGCPDSEIEPGDYGFLTVRSEAGDALLFDSLRLHQIRPFRGTRGRISITVHAAWVDQGAWEAWF